MSREQKHQAVHQRAGHHALRTAVALVVGASAALAQAADVQWMGGTGSWTDASRWSPHSPFTGDAVWIDGQDGVASMVSLPLRNFVSLQSLNLGASGSLTLHSMLTLQADLLSQGHLTIGEADSDRSAALRLSGNAYLGGNGTTKLGAFGRFSSNSGSLNIGAGHTLSGGGTLVFTNVANQGTIQVNGLMTLDGDTAGYTNITNTGVIRVINGGTFYAESVKTDNSGGLVDIVQGKVSHSNGPLYGGTVRGHGTDSFLEGGVWNATLEGQLQTRSLGIYGTVVNNGVLNLVPGAYVSGGVGAMLAGQGQVNAMGDAPVSFSGMAFGDQQAFRGSALVTDGLTNHGTFTVQGLKGLVMDTYKLNPLTNTGVIRVTSGSLLDLGRNDMDNTGGQLVFENDTRLISGSSITGGTLSATRSTRLTGTANFNDLALNGEWRTSSEFRLGVSGNIHVNGSLTIGDEPTLAYSSYLYLRGNTTFSGSGQTILAGGPTRSSSIGTEWPYDAPNSILTIDHGHTLRGNGTIGVNTVNKGLILADVPGGALQVHADLTNAGIVRIGQGASVLAAASIDNQDGVIDIADGGALRVYDGSVRGGVIHGQGKTSSLQVFNLRDATLTGSLGASDWSLFGSAAAIGVSGTLTNRGLLLVGGAADNGTGRGNVVIRQTAILQGEGRTELHGNGMLFGESRASHLIIGADHTVAGSGLMADMALTNRGRLDVENEGIRALRMVAFSNEGQIKVHRGAVLASDGVIAQVGSSSHTVIDGRVEAVSFDLQGGLLSGGGQLVGRLNAAAGSVRTGGAEGALRIDGDYIAGADSTLIIDLSSYQLLDVPLFVSGDVSLSGLLLLEFGADAKLGDSINILSGGGLVSGTFTSVKVLGSSFDVAISYFKDHVSVSLTSPVPEPSTLCLMGFGLLGMSMIRRRSSVAVAVK